MFLFLRTHLIGLKRRGIALLLALVLLPAIAHGLGDWAENAVPMGSIPLVGKYYGGDGLGYNINIELKEDGTFHADWHGCLGKYGEAQGRWRMENWEVVFEPDVEEGAMEGHLRTLHVFDAGGDWVLVAPQRVEDFTDRGAERWNAFQRLEVLEKKWAAQAASTADE